MKERWVVEVALTPAVALRADTTKTKDWTEDMSVAQGPALQRPMGGRGMQDMNGLVITREGR